MSALANLTLLLGKNTLPFPAFGTLNVVSPPYIYKFVETMPKQNISPSTRFFPHKERYEIFDGLVEKFKIFVQEFVPIRTALMDHKKNGGCKA